MKRKVVTIALFVALIGGGLLGTGYAFAQTPAPSGQSLVQMIASRFNLKTADVQSVFDQFRAQRQAALETKYENHLAQLVKDGKITDAQMGLLVTKHKDLVSKRQAEADKLKSMTPVERRQEMRAERQSLKDWAKQNNIPLRYLFGRFGLRGHHWMGKK